MAQNTPSEPGRAAGNRHFPPPPPLVSKPKGLWRRTPPAIFPPILGLFGLGLSWRTLAAQPGMHRFDPMGQVILGATLLLFTFALLAWLSKPLRRPGVMMQEIAVLPGRAGVVAMVLSALLAAAAIRPFAPGMALILVWTGLAALSALGALIGVFLLRGPQEQRAVTPVFHLTYVGYIVAPLSLVPLGYTQVATVILWGTIPVAMLIWGLSLRQLVTRTPPAPLRPLLAIHLAPAGLFTTVSALLGYSTLAMAFGILALVILISLLGSVRWLLAAGFSPMWGAMTFPLAACATACLVGLGPAGLWIGAILLIAATGLIPWIAFQILKAWAKGALAEKTNAATA